MNRYGWLLVLALALPTIGQGGDPTVDGPQTSGQRPPPPREQPRPKVEAPAEVIAWEPPDLGAPAHRSGGGTRGVCQLCSFAPRETALSATPTPRFYWYLEPGFRNNLRFRLKEEGANRPLLEVLLPSAMEGGIGVFDLADQGVALEEGKTYRWQVEMVPDAHQRWLRFAAGGWVIYRRPSRSVPKDTRKRLFYLARNGYWYDAVDELTRLIEKGGDAPGWLRQRAALLEQGGQHMLAQLDLERIGER